MELQKLRKKVDELDQQLVEVVVRRLELVKEIKDFKNGNSIEITDKERELQLLEDRLLWFREKGIDDSEFVQKLFGMIIEKSKEVENERAKEVQ